MKHSSALRTAGAVALVTACAAMTNYASFSEAEQAPPAKQEAAKPKPVATTAAPAKTTAVQKVPLDSSGGPVTITNDDLERMFGPSEVKPPSSGTTAEGNPTGVAKGPKPGDTGYDPLKAMDDEDKQAAEQQQKITTATTALAAAEANLKNLEARLLATKNPYLPRPQLSEAEAKQREGMDNVARVDLNEKEIQDARAEIERLRAELGQGQTAR